MKRIFACLLIGLLLSVLISCAVWAQGATAQISGTARDQSGAVLPGVEITATQTETGIPRTTVSNETGSYVLPNLPVGPYRLEVALPGFRTFVQTGIVLQVNSSPAINVVLEVGQVAENVEVQANAAMVETRSSGVGQVIENERILELPLNGRQALDLIVLAGAAVQTGTSSNRAYQGIPAVSVGGGLSTEVAYVLDGAMHNDPSSNLSLPLPFPDALQEFKVETSGMAAQNGMHSAASVQAVTKSGTNEYHGDLFEFVRNDLFNARSYFATKHSTLKRNQFGGTLGGPIKKNKLFFFGGFQDTTVRQDPADSLSFVPTATMLAGDFTAFTSPACNGGRQIALRAPFVNNRVDPALFSKPALTIASRLPKTDHPCGRVVYGIRNVTDEQLYIGKIDYQRSSNHSIFGRYLAAQFYSPQAHTLDPDNLLNTTGTGYDNLAQAFTLGDTYLMSSNMVLATRFAANRLATYRIGSEFFGAPSIGINIYSYLPKVMSLNVTGGPSLGAIYAASRTSAFQLAEDLSLIRGNHQMSFGVNLAEWRENFNSAISAQGVFAFNGQETGLGMGDFLLGKLTSLQQDVPNVVPFSQWYAGLYGQDTWKMTRRLTLNAGLRWEPYFPQQWRNGTTYNFDHDRFYKGAKSTVFKNAPSGFYYPGDPGFPNRSGIYKQWRDVAPRIGLAWDVNGDGRTSVRASYAYAYDFVTGDFGLNYARVSPWARFLQVNSPAGGFEDPYRGYPGGNPFPYVPDANAPFQPYGMFYALAYDQKTPRSQTWNLNIQRQVARDWLVSATYLGSNQLHVWTQIDRNPGIYFPGGPCTINGVTYNPCSTTANVDQRRQFSLERPQDAQYIGPLNVVDSGGTGNYHGMLLSVQRRAASGVTISGNYTWSHCTGDNVRIVEFTAQNGTRAPHLDRRLDRGNCLADRRQIFNLTAVAETPQFRNTTLRTIASGWRLSGIYKRSTGDYMNVLSGLDRALSGATNQRAHQVLENPYGDKSLKNYLNPVAFAQPALGTLGNLGYNNILGPSTFQFDTSLSRVFRFREAQRLEFRAEAYNLTNSLVRKDPSTNFSQNIFGQITAAGDPRILQFALKYVF